MEWCTKKTESLKDVDYVVNWAAYANDVFGLYHRGAFPSFEGISKWVKSTSWEGERLVAAVSEPYYNTIASSRSVCA